MSKHVRESNIQHIIKSISSYLPSRFLIIFSAAFIIPLLSKHIDYMQMSIYLIAIQILNLLCTTSFDGIGKIVLRFYEKYKFNKKLDEFFSSLFWISIIVYIITWLVYIFSHGIIEEKFAIDNGTLLIVLFLVIPCGIRQFLYQILRVYREASLYTISIIMYQILFIIFIFTIIKHSPTANYVLITMAFSVFIVDLFILSRISLSRKILLQVDKGIVCEILKYSIPLFFTNACYWSMLNISKFIFQYTHQYSNTAISGVTSTFANMVMQPLVSVFIFAAFPVIVKKYELKKKLKKYFTNLLQLFCIIFTPIIFMFCVYNNEITALVFPKAYDKVCILMPFYIVAVCFHELTKLINIKYHLKNIMMLELTIAIVTSTIALGLNFYLIHKYGLIGAALALFLSELLLLIINILVKTERATFINYAKLLKSIIISLIISVTTHFILSIPFSVASKYVHILEITLYMVCCYILYFILRKKLID